MEKIKNNPTIVSQIFRTTRRKIKEDLKRLDELEKRVVRAENKLGINHS